MCVSSRALCSRSMIMTSVDDETSNGVASAALSTNALVLLNVFYPVIERLDQSGYKDLQSDIRATLFKLEELYPGFSLRFLQSFMTKQMPAMAASTNMNELTLKLEKYCEKSSFFISPSRHEQEFYELNQRAKNLKRILSCIPDDITEKREFLETIKEIASAIKKTLDCVSNTSQYFKTWEGRQALENEKKEFIKSSKDFSNILKNFFRDSKRDEVYLAANHLLTQTDYLLRTIKLYCDTNMVDESLYPSFFQHQQHVKVRTSSLYPSDSQHYSNTRPSFVPSHNRPTSTYEMNYA